MLILSNSENNKIIKELHNIVVSRELTRILCFTMTTITNQVFFCFHLLAINVLI